MLYTRDTFDDDAKRKTVGVLRQHYHNDATSYDDPTKEKRVLQAVAEKTFHPEHMKWGRKKLKQMYKREEKTEFGTRRRVFSGMVVKDTSQGRETRTDFTENVDYREQQAPKKGRVCRQDWEQHILRLKQPTGDT